MARLRALVGGLVAAHLTTAGLADAAASARALAETIDVEPSDCLSRAALANKTAAFLHRDEVDARLSAVVTMRGADAFFRLSRDGAVVGERLVQRRSLTCDEFRSVVAAAIAVAIDTALLEEASAEPEAPPLELRSPLPPSPAAPAPEPPTPQTPRALPSPRSAPPEPPARQLALAFEPAVLTVLHEPSVGAALGLVLAQRPLGRVGLSSLATLPVDTELGGGKQARVGFLAGRLDACLEPPIRRLPIAPCAAAIVGAHRAESVVSSKSFSASDSTLWGALALGPEATFAFGQWSLVARIEPWWVVRPSRLVTAGPTGDLSSTAPRFGVAAFLGVRWTIF